MILNSRIKNTTPAKTPRHDADQSDIVQLVLPTVWGDSRGEPTQMALDATRNPGGVPAFAGGPRASRPSFETQAFAGFLHGLYHYRVWPALFCECLKHRTEAKGVRLGRK